MNIIIELIDYGPTVMLPILFIVIGLILRMPNKINLISSLKIGIGFYGISIVINSISTQLAQLIYKLSEVYNLDFNIFDVGWPMVAAASFKTVVGLSMIPICMLLNIILIHLNVTKTLNIDIWNYWHFSFIATISTWIFSSPLIGILAGILDFLLTNYYSDLSSDKIAENFELDRTSFPNAFTMMFYPIIKITSKVLSLPSNSKKNKEESSNPLDDQLMNGLPLIITFVIGLILSIVSNHKLPDVIYFSVVFASMILLIPLVSSLLGEGLEGYKQRILHLPYFKNKDVIVGLTPSLVIGDSTVMTIFALIIPISVLLSTILVGNNFFPISSLSGLVYLVPMVVSENNKSIKKSIVSLVLILMMIFYVINMTAPFVTELLLSNGLVESTAGLVSSPDYGSSPLLLIIVLVNNILSNHIMVVIVFLIFIFTIMFLNRKYVVKEHVRNSGYLINKI